MHRTQGLFSSPVNQFVPTTGLRIHFSYNRGIRHVHPFTQICILNDIDNGGHAKLPSMRYRYVSWPLMAWCFLSISARPGCAQSDRDLGVYVESHGSVPPIPD